VSMTLPGMCVPCLRDCLLTELRERGMAEGWPFRAALERIGYVGGHDVRLDMDADGWAIETALRRRVEQQRAARGAHERPRLVAAETVLEMLGLPSVPDVRRTEA